MSLVWRGVSVTAAMNVEFNKRLEIAALTVERTAKQLCPVDTGRLRNSIVHEVVKRERKALVGTVTKYAPYVELGTRFMQQQPFLRPGLENNREKLKRILTIGSPI